MSDSIKATVSEVAKDIKDAVGEMAEQGVQSVVGSQLTPQQIQQKQLQDQKDLSEARRKVEFYKKASQEQKVVRQANQQKEQQRLQNLKQDEQVKNIQIKQKKKQPINPAIAYAGKAEFKRGVGG